MTDYSRIINGVAFQSINEKILKEMIESYLEKNLNNGLPWNAVKALDRLSHIRDEFLKQELIRTVSQKQFIKLWDYIA